MQSKTCDSLDQTSFLCDISALRFEVLVDKGSLIVRSLINTWMMMSVSGSITTPAVQDYVACSGFWP